MPVGIQRLNARKSQPNERIVFIKPLKGPDDAVAQDFLERLAAQCLPIMREHHLSVMTLEEYEPNREFVGRNFNAGEVVQLVLKSLHTGRWLPFNYVQMVMMHELAHCKQMNHSRAFWAVRNNYAEQMRILWSRGYTGDGLWGRGALLSSGEFEKNTVHSGEALPEHLCGGTYRSRGRKRRAKPQPTYQERKERRILKKFGANGVALGDDEDTKAVLEKGRRTQAKPRVASSKRGRELRAAAALARFDQQKKAEPEEQKSEKRNEADVDTASEAEFETASESEDESATIDVNGSRLRDEKGRNLVKVCEDESLDDVDAKNELQELRSSLTVRSRMTNLDQEFTMSPLETRDSGNGNIEASTPKTASQGHARTQKDENRDLTRGSAHPERNPETEELLSPTQDNNCPMCSFENSTDATICVVCSHVLRPDKVSQSWHCKRGTCRESEYLNAGDAGICGICGLRRNEPPA